MKTSLRGTIEERDHVAERRNQGQFKRWIDCETSGRAAALAFVLVMGMSSFSRCSFAKAMPRDGAKPSSRPAASSTPAARRANPRITVLVFNYAKLDEGTLAGAEAVVTGIFRQANLETVWVDCSLWLPASERRSVCNDKLRATEYTIHLLPASMADAASASRDGEALGFAEPCPVGERGCVANIFYRRVEELAPEVDGRPARLLGHTMAHELGHLLLGNAHSPDGLMQGTWSREDLRFIGWSSLLFTAGQARQLRATVAYRMNLDLRSTHGKGPAVSPSGEPAAGR